MQLIINFEHLDSSDAIKDTIEQKANKLTNFFNGEFKVYWTCSLNKTRYRSHVSLVGDHLALHADSVQDDLYKTFDDVIAKLEKQLLKVKSKSKDHIHQQSNESYPPL